MSAFPHLAKLVAGDELVTVIDYIANGHEADSALVVDRKGAYRIVNPASLVVIDVRLLPGRREDLVPEHEHELGTPTPQIEGSRVVGVLRRCTVAGCDYSESKSPGATR